MAQKFVRTQSRRLRLHEMANGEQPGMGERFMIDGKRLAMVREESLQALPQSRQRHIKRMETEVNESQPQMRAMRQLGRSEGAAFKSAEQTGVGRGESFHGEEKAPARWSRSERVFESE